MKLVVGLGNPGDGYADTYHNVGFITLDALAERFGVRELRFEKKFNALIGACTVGAENVYLLKPQTFMNLSGDAVSAAARYYKIAPGDILVIYDDIDIKKGTVRARPNGSAGTHNGMRDIVKKLGSEAFPRVRIGTGLKPEHMELASYVLSKIGDGERTVIAKACLAAMGMVEDWIKGDDWQDMTVTV